MKWKALIGTLLVVLAAGACRKSEVEAGPGDAPPAAAQEAAAPDATAPSVTTTDAVVDPDVAKLAIEEPIAVSITDAGIEVKGSPVPGATQFQVTNNGTQQHTLAIEGPGVKAQLATPLQPQEVGSLTATMAPGTYRLYCPMEPESLTAQLEVVQPPH